MGFRGTPLGRLTNDHSIPGWGVSPSRVWVVRLLDQDRNAAVYGMAIGVADILPHRSLSIRRTHAQTGCPVCTHWYYRLADGSPVNHANKRNQRARRTLRDVDTPPDLLAPDRCRCANCSNPQARMIRIGSQSYAHHSGRLPPGQGDHGWETSSAESRCLTVVRRQSEFLSRRRSAERRHQCSPSLAVYGSRRRPERLAA